MSKIKGKDLIKLGFKKEKERSGGENYNYYAYEVNKHCLLLSCANNEKIDGGYSIEFYEISELRFTKLGDLKKLIKLLKKASNE